MRRAAAGALEFIHNPAKQISLLDGLTVRLLDLTIPVHR